MNLRITFYIIAFLLGCSYVHSQPCLTKFVYKGKAFCVPNTLLAGDIDTSTNFCSDLLKTDQIDIVTYSVNSNQDTKNENDSNTKVKFIGFHSILSKQTKNPSYEEETRTFEKYISLIELDEKKEIWKQLPNDKLVRIKRVSQENSEQGAGYFCLKRNPKSSKEKLSYSYHQLLKVKDEFFWLVLVLNSEYDWTEIETNQEIIDFSTKFNESNKVYKTVSFGEVDIRLPEIENWIECNPHPNIQKFHDSLSDGNNTVLAFFLNPEDYQSIDKIPQHIPGQFLKLYSSDYLKNIESDLEIFIKLSNNIERNYNVNHDWDRVINDIEHNEDFLKPGNPELMKIDQLNNNSKTFVFLGKYSIQKQEVILVVTMNLILMNKRLFWLAYYSTYHGLESINQSIQTNQPLLLSFQEINQ